MLQYPDLTLEDISYYWGHSTVMLERGGTSVACYIAAVRGDKRYPIVLNSIISGERVLSLSINGFIRRVLVHHPALGYGDYKGLPLYLSSRAGAHLRKGVDNANITALCPFNWKANVRAQLAALTTTAQKHIEEGRRTIPPALTAEHRKAQQLYLSMEGIAVRGANIRGRIAITDRKVTARVMEQCVNNRYPTIDDAIAELRTGSLHGVSISRDFALLHVKGVGEGMAAVYHRMAKVGTISTLTCEFTVLSTLSTEAQECVSLVFNRVMEK